MSIVAQPTTTAPVFNDIEYAYEFVTGKELWRNGKPLTACVNDAQRDGWQEAEAKGYDAFLRCLLEEAEHGANVDWDRGEVRYNAYGDGYW